MAIGGVERPKNWAQSLPSRLPDPSNEQAGARPSLQGRTVTRKSLSRETLLARCPHDTLACQCLTANMLPLASRLALVGLGYCAAPKGAFHEKNAEGGISQSNFQRANGIARCRRSLTFSCGPAVVGALISPFLRSPGYFIPRL